MYRDATTVTRVTTIGAGPIGGGWAAHFLAKGYDVTAYIHDASERAAFDAIVDTGWISLTALGLAPGRLARSAAGCYGSGRGCCGGRVHSGKRARAA